MKDGANISPADAKLRPTRVDVRVGGGCAACAGGAEELINGAVIVCICRS
jgi:hypothetical protein